MSVIDLQRLGVVSVYFGQVVYAPGGAFGPRVQHDLQLVMMDRGSVEVGLDGVAHRLGPGEVFVLWPGGREEFRFDRRRVSAHRWIALTLAGDRATRAQVEELRAALPFRAAESRELRALQRLGGKMQAQGAPTTGPMLTAMGLAYVGGLLDEGHDEAARAQATLPVPLAEALRCIASSYDQPLVLEDLASAASVTPHHLSRLFRKHLDATPMRTLWNTRVGHGGELLRDTGLTVAEVAYRVGFASPFHFSRLFKAQMGVAPTAWRESQWSRRRGG